MKAEWYSGGSPVTTGTANLRIWRYNNGITEFLQTDQTTWNSSAANHAMSVSGNYWTKDIVFPPTSDGFVVHFKATHSDTSLTPRYGRFYVTSDLTLTVEELDASPSVARVNKIQVTNATEVDAGSGTVKLYYKGIDQVTEVRDYKRARDNGADAGGAASEGFQGDSARNGTTLYVRDSVRLVVKGKCSPAATRSNFKITYRGRTFVEGTGADAGFIIEQGIPSTRYGKVGVGAGADFTDTDNLLKARWYFGEDDAGAITGIAAVAPGAETGASTTPFTVESDGQSQVQGNVLVDRTAPSFSSFTHSGMSFGQAAGTPMYRGEYVKWTWASSDGGSGLTATPVAFSQPAGSFLTGAPSTGAASGTTSYIRSSTGAPVTGTRNVRATATDLAGNVGTATDLDFHFTALPAAPTLAMNPAADFTNQIPNHLNDADFTQTSYDDDVITTIVRWNEDLASCRNSATNDNKAFLERDTGSSRLTIPDVGTVTHQAGTFTGKVVTAPTGSTHNVAVNPADIASQTERRAVGIDAGLVTQYYQLVESTNQGNYAFNPNRSTDFTVDDDMGPAAPPFTGHGFNPLTDEVLVNAVSSATIIGGRIRWDAAVAEVDLTVSITGNVDDDFQVRLGDSAGVELTFAAQGGNLAVEYWNGSSFVPIPDDDFGANSSFSEPLLNAATTIRLKVKRLNANGPDIGVVAVNFKAA